jgi:microcystin degradation protein MlrC
VETASVDEAIRRAMDAPECPVYLSDSGDNVTAGGAGDNPLFAERLLALGAQDAVVAGLADPQAVRQCAAAGVGAETNLSMGGKLDRAHGRPLSVRGRVQHLDPSMPPTTATVRVEGVTIVLAADRRAFADRASIAAAGVDLGAAKIVVVKLGYLFPDLYDHAPRAIMALSPGATDLRLERLPYRRLTRPIFPLDDGLDWAPH